MTTTNPVAAPQAPASPAPASQPPAPSSPLRLVILLGLLGLVIGAYGYDFFMARPDCEAADTTIQEFVDAQNKMGVKDASSVTPDAIHKVLGMQPTWREVHDDKDYEVEYYCWWGHVPVLNTRRHFITVVYVGKEPRRFSSHHREVPPEEALPITLEPGKDEGITLGQPESPSGAAAEAPAKADEPAAADAPAPESKSAPEGKEGDK